MFHCTVAILQRYGFLSWQALSLGFGIVQWLLPRPQSLFLLAARFFGLFSAQALAIAFPITAFQSFVGYGLWSQSWVSLGLCGTLFLIFMHWFKQTPNKSVNRTVKKLRFLPPGYVSLRPTK